MKRQTPTLVAIALWAAVLAPSALAQTDVPPQGAAPPALSDPDRPDVTNGTHIVDVGLLQIEVGGLYARPAGGLSAFGTPLTARVGLLDWLEARIGTDGLVMAQAGGVRTSGYGNTQLGAKLRLWADPGGVPVLSVLPTLNVPTASREKGLGSGKADFTIALLTGSDIGHHAHVDVNYGIGTVGDGDADARFVQHLLSVSGSYAVSDNWNPYAEAFWFSRQSIAGRSAASMDAGAIYQIGVRYAVDGGLQVGLSRDAPHLAAFGGVSILVGDVLGSHGAVARQRSAERRMRAGAPHK